jgi:hypothetical protein
VAKRSGANGWRNAAVVALAMKFEKPIAAVTVLGEGLDQGRPIFDKLARLKAGGQVPTVDLRISITGQITHPEADACRYMDQRTVVKRKWG